MDHACKSEVLSAEIWFLVCVVYFLCGRQWFVGQWICWCCSRSIIYMPIFYLLSWKSSDEVSSRTSSYEVHDFTHFCALWSVCFLKAFRPFTYGSHCSLKDHAILSCIGQKLIHDVKRTWFYSKIVLIYVNMIFSFSFIGGICCGMELFHPSFSRL